MIVYKYKGIYYFSTEDCSQNFSNISLPSSKSIPESLLLKLGVSKIEIADSQIDKLIENQKKKIREVRNRLLEKYDECLEPHFPIEQLDLDNIIAYRKYLRDYTEEGNWWKFPPMDLERFTNYDEGLYE